MVLLSPKHGVNPSLEQCFVCLKTKGVVLFGRLRGDAEAPRQVCLDQEPCAECKKLMKKGIVLISVNMQLTKDQRDPYRSGGWVVVRPAFIKRTIQPEEMVKDICKRRMAFVPDEVWDQLGLPRA